MLLPLLLLLLQDGVLLPLPLIDVCGLLLPLTHVPRLLPLLKIALLQNVCGLLTLKFPILFIEFKNLCPILQYTTVKITILHLSKILSSGA